MQLPTGPEYRHGDDGGAPLALRPAAEPEIAVVCVQDCILRTMFFSAVADAQLGICFARIMERPLWHLRPCLKPISNTGFGNNIAWNCRLSLNLAAQMSDMDPRVLGFLHVFGSPDGRQ